MPDALADQRRRQLRANCDRRLNPSAAQLYLLGLTLEQWVAAHLQRHAFYERRTDRKNSTNC